MNKPDFGGHSPVSVNRILRVLRPFAKHFAALKISGWELFVPAVDANNRTALEQRHIRAVAKLYRELGGK